MSIDWSAILPPVADDGIEVRLASDTLTDNDKKYISWVVRRQKRRDEEITRHLNTKPVRHEYPNHYDSQGYCDNPGRGY